MAHRLDRLPYPLAHAARAVETARDPEQRLERAQHFVEMTAVTLGVLVLGWCRTRDVASDAVRDWESAVDSKGVALGRWTALVGAVSKVMVDRPDDPVARSIRLAANGALPRLNGFIPTRNEFAHGGKPRMAGDVAVAADGLTERVSAIVDALEPLTHVRVGVISRVTQGRPGEMHSVDLDVAVGFADLFAPRQLRSTRPYEAGAVVAYGDAGLDGAVDLAPYCRWQVCPTCGRHELFYLSKRKKNRADHFSFTTGHQLRLRGEAAQPPPPRVNRMGMEPLGARRYAATHGWRSSWPDLAPRASRFAARVIDTVIVAVLAAAGCFLAAVLGLPTAWIAVAGIAAGGAYEPVAALRGGSFGKRILRIEPVSVWDSRRLKQTDALRRAIVVDLQLLFPPLAARNLAWLLWDPARQCLHDRRASSIVVAGRTRSDQAR